MSEVKTAVVTGGASGIGEATARRFRAGGWAVEIADRDAGRGAAVAAEIGAGFTALDVTDDAGITAFAAAVITRRGRVQALVNSAAILQNAGNRPPRAA